jgi:hypothetical protein
MFKPDKATAEKFLQASPTLVLEMRARAAQKETPGPVAQEVDLADVQEVLGEEVSGLLGLLARQRACHAPGARMSVADLAGFREEMERHLVSQFRLSRQHPGYREAMAALARDFCTWVRRLPTEAGRLHLAIDPKGEVTMTCNLPGPVLDALVD